MVLAGHPAQALAASGGPAGLATVVHRDGDIATIDVGDQLGGGGGSGGGPRLGGIVNAANWHLGGGTGVDGAIHRAGGDGVATANTAIRASTHPAGLPVSHVVGIDAVGALNSTYIFHVNPPKMGMANADDWLYASYQNALLQADQLGVAMLAFPLLSAGVFGTGTPAQARARSLGILERVVANTPTHHVRLVIPVIYAANRHIGRVTIAPGGDGGAFRQWRQQRWRQQQWRWQQWRWQRWRWRQPGPARRPTLLC